MTMTKYALALAGLFAPVAAFAAAPADPRVERIAPDRLRISWTGTNGVDVYMADRPDATVAQARLVSADDRDGVHDMAVGADTRPYFLLKDHKDGATVHAAERLLPLEHSSNFRDIGGYPAAGGKHVKWGMLYRSGAMSQLTPADRTFVGTLGLADIVDLRSIDERQLAPTPLDGIAYHAVGYRMSWPKDLPAPDQAAADRAKLQHGASYASMPERLAPQLRVLFGLLRTSGKPLLYNCMAGQDRTGFVTAIVLSALGVPRDAVVADYNLTPGYRRPQYEIPTYDATAFPDNGAAQMFAYYAKLPGAMTPYPLKDADGTAFLTHALDAVDTRYGSVEAYLAKEIGFTAVDIAALRATYLE